MSNILEKKIIELEQAENYECWYLVKQDTTFSSLCFQVDFLEQFQNDSKRINLEMFMKQRVSDLNIRKNLKVSEVHRALRVAAFFGLIQMVSSSYNDAVITPTFKKIKELCNGDFEKTYLYEEIIQRQIEKIFISSKIDEQCDSTRKDFRLFPVMLLYKILLELGRSTGEFQITLNEYRYLVATTKKYDNYLVTLLQILLLRDNPTLNTRLEKFKSKFDNRFIQALKQLKTLTFGDNNISISKNKIDEVRKKVNEFEKNQDKILSEDYIKLLTSNKSITDLQESIEIEHSVDHLNHNLIFSGAPGTGKSYNVSKLVKEYYPDFENEENEQSQFVFRTTLHPEYTYSDFVGQIMPVTKDDKIDYDFIPGVFTRALEKAISFEQTNQKVFLILEELSRANVASVFGDLFQLLDRKNGKSEYPISNSLIAKEVFHSGPLKNEDGSINKENEKLQNKKIYLPPNLYILCTVNTSDQNVFVMDTAFKRRFDWIPVLTDPVKNLKTGDYINNPEITIDGVKLKWCEFYPILNNYITSKMGLSEDKQIGQFFIKFDDNSSTEVVQTLLKNKLLQYLWDDVENAAYSKKLFEGITSFSELYKKFGVTQIFNAELITALNNIKNSDIEITNDNQSIELNNNVELDENLVAE
ncbi:AAA family ATPase [Streptococcus uberis]|uniref:AAA family ATPase n=1 Tax=Streptococcus uberis TaxID=1349 RepID=UPI001FF33BEF|nr:AAA family ATPase [Streptococcus uberis]MCK1229538.1 AAA family ATPase [Streptococcus uberis]